jgi:hypothetical protein
VRDVTLLVQTPDYLEAGGVVTQEQDHGLLTSGVGILDPIMQFLRNWLGTPWNLPPPAPAPV